MDVAGFVHPPELPGTYVLVVDAEAERRGILREMLRYCGALVQEARSVPHARGLMSETVPRILVLGVRPPTEAAWRTVRELRAARPEHGGKIPIVGVGPAPLAAEARVNGLDAYVQEPIEIRVLCQVVAELAR
jgi:CheY-like chemotaxis protein